jgi:hypothetical protein
MDRGEFQKIKRRLGIFFNKTEVRLRLKNDSCFGSVKFASDGNGGTIIKPLRPLKHLGVLVALDNDSLLIVNAGNQARIPLEIIKKIEKINSS